MCFISRDTAVVQNIFDHRWDNGRSEMAGSRVTDRHVQTDTDRQTRTDSQSGDGSTE